MKTTKYLLVILIILTTKNLPQNIEAKLGTSGYFQIKNLNNTTILSVNSVGSLTLPHSSNNSAGVIYKDSDMFLHDNGTDNVFLGKYAGNLFLESGTIRNCGVGSNSLSYLTLGSENSAFGFGSLQLNTEGSTNCAFGSLTLSNNSTGSSNTALGTYSLKNNTTGNSNTASGIFSLYSNITGSNNTATGVASLYSNTIGEFNTAMGINSLYFNTIGSHNTASGSFSLFSNTTGIKNTALGAFSLASNTTGVNNTAFGYNSLNLNTEGFHNTAVGYESLKNNTGNYNTAVGFNAGSTVTTGANLTLLGIDANPSSPTAVDEITLGNQFVQTLRCNATTITSLSDERDKKNIKDLSLGLDFLMKIKPREFNWDRREWYADGKSDGSKMQEERTAGFIAQELDKTQTEAEAEWLKLVLKENPDRIEASSGNLFPIVVKAVQDLKKEKDNQIAQLKFENENLRRELESLKDLQNRLTKIESAISNSEVKFTSNITE